MFDIHAHVLHQYNNIVITVWTYSTININSIETLGYMYISINTFYCTVNVNYLTVLNVLKHF